jgi:hypothetical protein
MKTSSMNMEQSGRDLKLFLNELFERIEASSKQPNAKIE